MHNFQIGDLIISTNVVLGEKKTSYWHIIYISIYGTAKAVQLVNTEGKGDWSDIQTLSNAIAGGTLIYAPIQVQQAQI